MFTMFKSTNLYLKQEDFNEENLTSKKLDKVLTACDLGKKFNQAILVENLLSPEECKRFIDHGNKNGFPDVGYPKKYRNNGRIIVDDQPIAQELFRRLQPVIKDFQILITPDDQVESIFGSCLEGQWMPKALNNHFRFCKYETNGHFSRHTDSYYQASSEERSFLTVMLYLNSDYEDGCTNFFADHAETLAQGQASSIVDDTNISYSLKAPTGSALIFTQQTILHEGQQVSANQKYIFRTDLMYERLPETKEKYLKQKSEAEILADELLAKAQLCEANHQLDEATKYYSKAFKLNPKLETLV